LELLTLRSSQFAAWLEVIEGGALVLQRVAADEGIGTTSLGA